MATAEQDTIDVQNSIHIRHMLDVVLRQVWRNIDRAIDPPAQDLFERTAEVLDELKTAYEHYAANGKASAN